MNRKLLLEDIVSLEETICSLMNATRFQETGQTMSLFGPPCIREFSYMTDANSIDHRTIACKSGLPEEEIMDIEVVEDGDALQEYGVNRTLQLLRSMINQGGRPPTLSRMTVSFGKKLRVPFVRILTQSRQSQIQVSSVKMTRSICNINYTSSVGLRMGTLVVNHRTTCTQAIRYFDSNSCPKCGQPCLKNALRWLKIYQSEISFYTVSVAITCDYTVQKPSSDFVLPARRFWYYASLEDTVRPLHLRYYPRGRQPGHQGPLASRMLPLQLHQVTPKAKRMPMDQEARDSANSFVMHGEKGPEDITRIDAKKDLGIWLSPNLSFSLHLEKSAQKAFAVLRMIRRTFSRITRTDFQILYGAYVRPLLEYANPVVYSGRTKDVILIECFGRVSTVEIKACDQMLKMGVRDTRCKATIIYLVDQNLNTSVVYQAQMSATWNGCKQDSYVIISLRSHTLCAYTLEDASNWGHLKFMQVRKRHYYCYSSETSTINDYTRPKNERTNPQL
ncbi:hypothetical protein CLF_111499 [Clonorchis sinensis]|uniref:Uncharacterized protein n=1 Tax=Clonorchis sinensis TaxID=79923 RepID=G7YLP8_CLOSI|nr:hypothetical protein CLF_111499 [Clonorchis sinensis]